MTTNEQYINLAKQLGEIARAHQKVFSDLSASLKFADLEGFSQMRPLFEEFEKINSLKMSLPPLDMLLGSQALQDARMANLSISKLFLSPEHDLTINTFLQASETWKTHLAPIASFSESLNASFAGIQAQIAKLSETSLFAEKFLVNTDFNHVAQLLDVSETLQQSIRGSQFDFADSYSRLFKSIEDSRLSFLSLPSVVSTLPPIEFYFGNRFIERITVPDAEIIQEDSELFTGLEAETTDDVEACLGRLDPSLIKLWRGAVQAMTSRNPDAIRHCVVSLRELLTHILHKLAPDDEIGAWSTEPEFYHEGKPTRRARLLYICRGIDHEPFKRFLRKDVDSVLASFNVFQEGTHAVDPSLSFTQLDLLRIRTESSIRFLVRTHLDASGG